MSFVPKNRAHREEPMGSGLVTLLVTVDRKLVPDLLRLASGERCAESGFNVSREIRPEVRPGRLLGSRPAKSSARFATADAVKTGAERVSVQQCARDLLTAGSLGVSVAGFSSVMLVKALSQREREGGFVTPATSGLHKLFLQLGYKKFPRYVKWLGATHTFWIHPECAHRPLDVLKGTQLNAQAKYSPGVLTPPLPFPIDTSSLTNPPPLARSGC